MWQLKNLNFPSSHSIKKYFYAKKVILWVLICVTFFCWLLLLHFVNNMCKYYREAYKDVNNISSFILFRCLFNSTRFYCNTSFRPSTQSIPVILSFLFIPLLFIFFCCMELIDFLHNYLIAFEVFRECVYAYKNLLSLICVPLFTDFT